jgi:hypothetical protein
MSPVVFLQPETPTRLILRRGVSAVLVAKGLLRRFVLGDPQIVALNALTERELVVNAKAKERPICSSGKSGQDKLSSPPFGWKSSPSKRKSLPLPQTARPR